MSFHVSKMAVSICIWNVSVVTYMNQWRNRRGQGEECPPRPSDREISADLQGKKRQWKKEETNWAEDPYFFYFFIFFIFFICFSLKFSKPLKCVGLPNWKSSTGKKHFTPGKKSGKIYLPPQKIFLLRRPWHVYTVAVLSVDLLCRYSNIGIAKCVWFLLDTFR